MANTMDLSTFLKGLQESGTDGTSRYNLRNENEQTKERVGSIPKLKKEKKKLNEQKAEIKDYESYAKTKEYTEEVARNKLGLVYPNEIIFEPNDK